MAHSLILGMTESGKTTLAKQLAQKYADAGHGILILDPLNDPGWPEGENIFKTDDQTAFLDMYWNNQSCMAFIDESGDMVGKYNDLMNRTATRGRHWGHCNHYISQRASSISKTVRDQCGFLALFASSKADGKIHADEWNKDELSKCNDLQKGEFFYTGRFTAISRCRAF